MIDVRRVAESSLSSLENGLKTATNDAAIGLAVRWEYEHQSTDYFPLQIYASAIREDEPDSDRILIVGTQFHRPRGRLGRELEVSADIAWEGDVVVADIRETPICLDHPDAAQQLAAARQAIADWLQRQIPLIRSELQGQPESTRKVM